MESEYYKNQNDELIAKVKWSSIRMERAKAQEKGKYSSIQLPHPWTKGQVKDIEEQVLAEEYRGAKIRYWEDVKVGDELKPVVKGPLGLTDEIAFLIGGGAPIPSLSLMAFNSVNIVNIRLGLSETRLPTLWTT